MEQSTRGATWSQLGLGQRLALTVYVVGEYAFVALLSVALAAAWFAPRAAAYVALAGLVAHFVVRQVAIPVFAHEEGAFDPLTRLQRRSLLAASAGHIAIAVGVVAGFLEWQPGAYVAMSGLLATLGGHLLVGVSAYRNVMAREWPQVEPVAGDEW